MQQPARLLIPNFLEKEHASPFLSRRIKILHLRLPSKKMKIVIRLTLEQRYTILGLRNERKSLTSIVQEINRDKSVVLRELKRKCI